MTRAVQGGAGAAPIADSLAKIKVPLMLLSGSKDARITAAMPSIDSAMKAMGKSYSYKNYATVPSTDFCARRTILNARRPIRRKGRRTSMPPPMAGRVRWPF